MISTELKRAKKFQQGLIIELQEMILFFHFQTREVLKAAKEHVRLSGFKRAPQGGQKRPFQ